MNPIHLPQRRKWRETEVNTCLASYSKREDQFETTGGGKKRLLFTEECLLGGRQYKNESHFFPDVNNYCAFSFSPYQSDKDSGQGDI